jgi:colanic acid biosynthesis glycosyl transferase WcaI
MTDRHPVRLLLVTPYFRPDLGPIPILYGDLVSDLATMGYEVLVLTAQPNYAPGVERTSRGLYQVEKSDHTKIVRVLVPRLRRESLWSRLMVLASFNLLGCLYLLFAPRCDIALIINPAMETWMLALVAGLKGIPFHFRVHDLYPEIAIRLGLIKKGGLLARLIDCMERLCLKYAASVSVVTESFLERLVATGVPRSKVTVIPDWSDTSRIHPAPKQNTFSKTHNLCGRFVILYAGNVGRSQGLEVLLEAASLLKGESDIVFLVVGEGAKKPSLVSLCQKKQLKNVIFLPYQPQEGLNDVHSAPDVGFVSLLPGVSPEWCPGKVYTIMASARPILAAVDIGASEVYKLIERTQCGVCVEAGNPVKLAEVIRELVAHPDQLATMGANGRRAVERHYSRQVCTMRLAELLADARSKP